MIVTAGADQDGAYASGIVPALTETGGTCMLTASNGSTELNATRQGEGATGSTNCGLLRIDVGPGDWELTLSYISATAEGRSAPEVVSVP
ncbi:hypothetical protein JNB63_05010 [Microbacterium trichothecenolyticum]|uniref:hypothetical protein n=1 Tax=Microbacterium trichothecenolyticum TaxID=69370 RepID=UPI001C6F10A1|nr:hypothetical protein [Microbacterium trichothecenolyticum]MBW9119447.1 hypothetical protein [Microbacterium trichothecenolyticum]